MRFAFAVGVAAFAAAAAAEAAEHEWRIQTFLPATFTVVEEFGKWAAALEEKSGGAISIEVLPVGAVVGVTETLDAMRSGVLTGHFTGPPYFAGKDPAFAVIGDTLAAYDDPAQRDGWWQAGGLDYARRLYGEYGAHLIGPVYTPAEWMPSTRPLAGVADLDGIKMRAPQGMVSELFARFGVGVVVLPGTEVYNALETGVVDAADWGWLDLNDTSGLFKVAKYAMYAPHSMGVTEVSVSQSAWDALSPELQTLVETELAAFSEHMRSIYEAQEAAAETRVQEAGVTLIRWPESERETIRAALLEIWEDMASRSDLAREAVDLHLAYMAEIGLR